MLYRVCSTMNVCSLKPWDTKHGVTQYFQFTVICFLLRISLYVWCEYDWKKLLYWLFVCTNQSNQLFSPCPKILLWYGYSDFKIIILHSALVMHTPYGYSDKINHTEISLLSLDYNLPVTPLTKHTYNINAYFFIHFSYYLFILQNLNQ